MGYKIEKKGELAKKKKKKPVILSATLFRNEAAEIRFFSLALWRRNEIRKGDEPTYPVYKQLL